MSTTVQLKFQILIPYAEFFLKKIENRELYVIDLFDFRKELNKSDRLIQLWVHFSKKADKEKKEQFWYFSKLISLKDLHFLKKSKERIQKDATEKECGMMRLEKEKLNPESQLSLAKSKFTWKWRERRMNKSYFLKNEIKRKSLY